MVHAEGGEEPGVVDEVREEEEGKAGDEGVDEEHLVDVLFLVMADLVSEDGDEFVWGMLFDEGVEEDNAFEAAEAGEEGVGFSGAAGAIHGIDALEFKVLGGGEFFYFGAEFAWGEGSKFVEEG